MGRDLRGAAPLKEAALVCHHVAPKMDARSPLAEDSSVLLWHSTCAVPTTHGCICWHQHRRHFPPGRELGGPGSKRKHGPSITPDAGGRCARGCLSLAWSGGCGQRACECLGIASPPVLVGRKGPVGRRVVWLESFRSPCRPPTSAERNFSSRFYLLLSCPEFAWLFFKQTSGILSDSLALLVSPWNFAKSDFAYVKSKNP